MISRVDIAIDDFTNDYFDISDIIERIKDELFLNRYPIFKLDLDLIRSRNFKTGISPVLFNWEK